MISLLVDEAYAFDFLAILEIKYEYSNFSNEILKEKIDECKEHFTKQISKEKLEEILSSKEYAKLLIANKNTFEWVDKAKTNSCKASDVDRSNYDRCKARNLLQEKFFPNKKISEVKIGYGIYDKSK